MNTTTSIPELHENLKEFSKIWDAEYETHDYTNHPRLDELAIKLFNADENSPLLSQGLASGEKIYLEYAKILAHSKKK